MNPNASCSSCSSDSAVPYTSDNCGQPPDDGGDCAYCEAGQMGGLPDPGTNVDYCGGLVTWSGITPVCPS